MGVTLPRQTDRYYNEKLRKYRDGTPDHLRDGSLHAKSRRHLEELHVDVEKLSIRAAFAIAYMAARASEHLTADPTRPAESQSPRATPLSAHF